jgi:hypothetical protein
MSTTIGPLPARAWLIERVSRYAPSVEEEDDPIAALFSELVRDHHFFTDPWADIAVQHGLRQLQSGWSIHRTGSCS